MGRTYEFWGERCRFLYGPLNELTVFAYDVAVVSVSLFKIQGGVCLEINDASVERTESAECIACEKDSAFFSESHHCFRPMHHGSHQESQGDFSEVEFVSVAYGNEAFLICDSVKTSYHSHSLLVADYLHFRILCCKERNGTAVVRLHMVDDEIVYFRAAQHFVKVAEKGQRLPYFHRVYERGFV